MSLNDTEKEQLKKEQRKWIKYRNSEAAKDAAEFSGGRTWFILDIVLLGVGLF